MNICSSIKLIIDFYVEIDREDWKNTPKKLYDIKHITYICYIILTMAFVIVPSVCISVFTIVEAREIRDCSMISLCIYINVWRLLAYCKSGKRTIHPSEFHVLNTEYISYILSTG